MITFSTLHVQGFFTKSPNYRIVIIRFIDDSDRECIYLHITQGIRTYIEMTKKIRMKLNWKTDKRISMTLASIYILNKQVFQYNRFASLCEELNHPLNQSYQMSDDFKYFYAAVIDVSFEDIEGVVPYCLDLYDMLKREKFPTGTYTYLSSFILWKKGDDDRHEVKIINNASEIYQSIKRKHRFFTDDRQYPLATMRAAEKQRHHEQDHAFFYHQLKKRHFSRGRNLLLLSQILTLPTEHDSDTLVQRAQQFFSDFIEMKIDPRAHLYPLFGLLVLLPEGTVQLSTILEIYEQLTEEKLFRRHKDMSALMSVIFFVEKTSFQPYLVEVLLYTMFEGLQDDAQNNIYNFRSYFLFD